MPPKILIAEPLDFNPDAVRLLEQAAQVELRNCNRDDLKQAMANYDVVWFRLAHRIDRTIIQAASRCRILAVPVTGLDHIDLDACAERGIEVVSLRGEVEFLRNIRATAELTIGITLALLRQIPQAAQSATAGQWNRDLFRGEELYGKTVGLVGVGRLGSLAAKFFAAFGAQVIGYDPRPDFPLELARRVESLEAMLADSDIVSVHASYTPATRHLLSVKQFAAMKPGAILINTSRGGIVDDQALVDSLDAGRLAGAALDVLDGEPDIGPDHPLIQYARSHDNLLIVPHIGGNTRESFAKTELFLAAKVLETLAKQAAKGSPAIPAAKG